MAVRVAELETLFTADDRNFGQVAAQVETRQRQLDGKRATIEVQADGGSALREMDSIEAAVQGLPDGELTVDADTAKASSDLQEIGSEAKSLPDGEINVEADTSSAERDLSRMSDVANKEGTGGGKAFMGGFLGGLASTPVAGIVVGLAQDIGQSFVDAFGIEVRSDRLMAQTGLDEATTARLGRAAAEAYAGNFGESLDANFQTARQAIQTGLLDPNKTQAEAQRVIQSLSGIADVMEEDVAPVSRATAQLLRTGLAKSADEAFDIIVKGQQAGLNASEDWLDTINEYSTQWRKLGLEGDQVLGLLSQGVRAGARDTDVAADALKEFSIRAIDGSTTTKAGFDAIGLSASDMSAKIAAGGPQAAEALDLTLDKLRAIEDPTARAAAAVQLFGTQAEDMGDALYAMDLSTAVDQLGQVEGAAKRAIDTLGDNSAGQIESAKRNIEVAAQGIQGALAAAFNPQIEDFANFVSENREQVMQFLLDLANGAFDFARSFVEGIATSTEAVGDFVSSVAPAMIDAIEGIVSALDWLPGDQHADEFRAWAESAKESLANFDESTEQTAATIREQLIENGIDPAQQKLNDFAMPLVTQAALHDALTATANDVANVGVAADGTALQVNNLNGSIDLGTEAGRRLDGQIKQVVESMYAQAGASAAAGESSEDLTGSLQGTRDELVNTLTQLGFNKAEAEALADAYGAIPGKVATDVQANTGGAQAAVDNFIRTNNGRKIVLTQEISQSGNPVYRAGNGAKLEYHGGIVQPMAVGGIPGTALDPIAQFVSPGTLRVVGDRLDVDEAYVPLDGSARSWTILQEALRRMPGIAPMAAGGVAPGAGAAMGGGDTYYVTVEVDMSRLQTVAQVENFVRMIPQLSRQKSGVRR